MAGAEEGLGRHLCLRPQGPPKVGSANRDFRRQYVRRPLRCFLRELVVAPASFSPWTLRPLSARHRNTLEYYELDGRGRRKHNKPSPIVFKIDSEGEYLFSEVTDAGAAHFRQRNARRLKDGSINPHRVTAGDGRQDDGEEETAEDDDESGAQTTGTGSTSQEDSDAPPEPADAAEPMVRAESPLVVFPLQSPPRPAAS
jgi:hypothetical protein